MKDISICREDNFENVGKDDEYINEWYYGGPKEKESCGRGSGKITLLVGLFDSI